MITPLPWFRGSNHNSSQLLIFFRRVITLPSHVSIEMRGSFVPCIHSLLFFLMVSQTWNLNIVSDRFTLVFILVTLSKRKTWRKTTISYFGYKNSSRIFVNMPENDPEPGDLVIAVRISLTRNLTTWSVSSSRSSPEITSHGMCLWGEVSQKCGIVRSGGFGFEFSACG